MPDEPMLETDSTQTSLIEECAKHLRASKTTIAVAESSSGGLISASLLSVAGASAYFTGGTVIYTRESRRQWLDIDPEKLRGLEPMTELMAGVFAEAVRLKLNATWGMAELGAAGPTGTPYGHDAGTSVIAINGPVCASILVSTGDANRVQNMQLFTSQALKLLRETLSMHARG